MIFLVLFLAVFIVGFVYALRWAFKVDTDEIGRQFRDGIDGWLDKLQRGNGKEEK